MALQYQRFERLAKGEDISQLYEIFLLTFADLKKHLFNYQFYSTNIPVVDYKITKWENCKNWLID